MASFRDLSGNHRDVTRRYFLQLGAAGVAAWSASALAAADPKTEQLLEEAITRLEYLTSLPSIKPGGRGTPPPSKLPPEKLREVGLVPETWFLEVPVGNTWSPYWHLKHPRT